MYKKIISMVVVLILTSSLVACGKDITIDIENLNIELIDGNTYQIDYDTNDTSGLSFESSNQAVLTVSSSGLVTAVSEGEATVSVTSKENPEIKVTVTVIVIKNYIIHI